MLKDPRALRPGVPIPLSRTLIQSGDRVRHWRGIEAEHHLGSLGECDGVVYQGNQNETHPQPEKFT